MSDRIRLRDKMIENYRPLQIVNIFFNFSFRKL